MKVKIAIAKAKVAEFESGTREQYANAELRLRIARTAYETGDVSTALAQLYRARDLLDDYCNTEEKEYKHPKSFDENAPPPTSFAVLLQEVDASGRIADIDEIIIFIGEKKDINWDAYAIYPLQDDDVRIAVPHPTIDGFWLSNTGMFHRHGERDKGS